MAVSNIFKNIFFKNFILAIITILLLVLGILWWLNIYTNHNESVVVPDVKGLQVYRAAEVFNKSNLSYEVIDSVFNKSVAPGAIIETIPPIGTKVKEHRKIFITINAFNSQTTLVPDVLEQSQRQAVAKLKSAGFTNIHIRYVQGAYLDLVAGIEYKGRSIKKGDRLPLDSHIFVLVSNGTAFDTMPEDSLDIDSDGSTEEESWF